MDLYLGEVAPDSHLKPSKFLALLLVLPDYARESDDHIYKAMDLFLEVCCIFAMFHYLEIKSGLLPCLQEMQSKTRNK
jgi:hypothetical protein